MAPVPQLSDAPAPKYGLSFLFDVVDITVVKFPVSGLSGPQMKDDGFILPRYLSSRGADFRLDLPLQPCPSQNLMGEMVKRCICMRGMRGVAHVGVCSFEDREGEGVREDTSTESGDCSELSQGITDPAAERRVIRREVEFDSLLSRRDGKAFL